MYECKPYPYTGWCNGAAWAYAPGTGAYWQDAWVFVSSCTVSKAANFTKEEMFISSVPNPFESSTTITVNVETAGNISVVIYDSKGIEMKTLVNQYFSAGIYSFELDGINLNSGIYVCRMINNDKAMSTIIFKQ